MSHPPYARSGSEAFADSEVEVLQTDVMRFMALLGFILMAIFALVQALPVAPARNQPRIDDAALLREDLRVLEQQLAAQTVDLIDLQNAIAAARVEQQRLLAENRTLERRLAELQESAADIEEQLTLSDRELAATAADLDRGRQTLGDIRRRVERERHVLQLAENRAVAVAAETQAMLDEQQRLLVDSAPPPPAPQAPPDVAPPAAPVAEVPAEPEGAAAEPAQPQPKTIAERLAEIRQLLPAPPVESPAAAETAAPAAPPAAAPQKRGFTLRFASTAAFDRLLADQTIRFYALLERRAWQFQRSAGTISTAVVEAPWTYYEMAPATVPAAYRTALRRIVAAPAGGAVTWGVVLPPEIVAKINLAARQLSGADIIIAENGSVLFENESR